MIFLTGIILVAASLVSCSQDLGDPFELGPYNVTHYHFPHSDFEGLDENLDVYIPSSGVNVDFPIVYFLDGLAMGLRGSDYSELCTHLSSHGLAVIIPSMSSILTPSQKVPYFASVMEWCEINLEGLLHDMGAPLDVTLDFTNLFATSHSAGSHVLVAFLKEQGCKNFKAMVLMSPVDGVDAAGIIPDFCITPGEELNFAIPTLLLVTGYDTAPGFSGYPCAPEDLSNERFWNALRTDSHRWSINATDFAHLDFTDDSIRHIAMETKACGFNEYLPEEVVPTYRQFIGGSILSFLRALTEENCEDYLKYLEDPSVMLVETTARFVNPTGGCPSLYCTWIPET